MMKQAISKKSTYVKVYSEFQEVNDLSASQVLILSDVISMYERGLEYHKTKAVIARTAMCSVQTVRRCLIDLEMKHYITLSLSPSKFDNRYRIELGENTIKLFIADGAIKQVVLNEELASKDVQLTPVGEVMPFTGSTSSIINDVPIPSPKGKEVKAHGEPASSLNRQAPEQIISSARATPGQNELPAELLAKLKGTTDDVFDPNDALLIWDYFGIPNAQHEIFEWWSDEANLKAPSKFKRCLAAALEERARLDDFQRLKQIHSKNPPGLPLESDSMPVELFRKLKWSKTNDVINEEDALAIWTWIGVIDAAPKVKRWLANANKGEKGQFYICKTAGFQRRYSDAAAWSKANIKRPVVDLNTLM